jgi:hypothetical protein
MSRHVAFTQIRFTSNAALKTLKKAREQGADLSEPSCVITRQGELSMQFRKNGKMVNERFSSGSFEIAKTG